MHTLATCLLAFVAPDVGRGYSGPTDTASPIEPKPELLEPSSSARTPPARTEPKPTPPTSAKPVDKGERWRLAVTVGVHALASAGFGVGLGGFVGAGVPVKQQPRRRIRHAFGYATDVSFVNFGSVRQTHRFAASGLVGRYKRDDPRKYAFYYFAAVGADVYGRDYAGPSLGARIGLASSKRLEYIIAIGADLDVLMSPGTRAAALPIIYLSLLTFGSL